MRIEDREPKGNILDSGYYRATGNVKFAELMRKVQSTVIANGNELEGLLVKYSNHPNTSSSEKLANFDLAQTSAFVVQMALRGVDEKGKNINLDAFLCTLDKVYIFEIKDGMFFDTKKSAGEVSSLNKAAAFVRQKDPLGREVVPKIVLWNCKDIDDASFKCEEGIPMLMTGEEFAELVPVDREVLYKERQKDMVYNERWCVARCREIVELYQELLA